MKGMGRGWGVGEGGGGGVGWHMVFVRAKSIFFKAMEGRGDCITESRWFEERGGNGEVSHFLMRVCDT